jgi:RNA polymerase sigma-70 factor (ECF subfamily)
MAGSTGAAIAELDVSGLSRDALEARFRAILAANGPALGRLAATYTRSSSDRDDLLQDIAMGLWQALPRFRGECSDRTFVFRIAHNRGLAHAGRKRRIVQFVEGDPDPPAGQPDPEAELSREQQSARLLEAIRQLPVIHREVLVLALEGLGYREIAQVLGISDSNVGVRLNRARKELKVLLEDPR